MATILGIEPSAATAIDTRTGKYASRRRAPYPRSLINLGGILREPDRALFLASQLGVDSYSVDPSLPIQMIIHDRLALGFAHEEEIPGSEEGYSGPVTYYRGVRYGEPGEETASFLRGFPDARIVAIPAIFSGSRTEVVETARIVKSVNPNLLVVCGGTYATADPYFLLESGFIDIVVIGEAWLSFPALVHTYLQGGALDSVRGIMFRRPSGEISDNTLKIGHYPFITHYDAVPYPAWDFLDFDPYDVIGLTHLGDTAEGQLVAPVDSEVGCGLKCKFCAAGVLNEGRLVKKSADRLFSEVRTLVEQFGRNTIHFDSDNPLIDNARAIRFFEALRDYNRQRILGGEEIVRFAFPNGTAPWTFRSSQMISLMVEAGLFHISIAVESASPKTLQRLGKSPRTPKLAYEAIRSIRDSEKRIRRGAENNLIIEIFIMLGVPGEQNGDIEDTMRFCNSLSADFGVIVAPFYFAPLHGTPLFDDFFSENPKARALPWPVLGWLGTEKWDNPARNVVLSEARTTLYNLSRHPSSNLFVRL